MGRSGLLKPSESQIELQLLDYLVRVRGYLAWKNQTTGYFDPRRNAFRRHQNPYARNGVADILCIIEGRLVALEVKSASGRQSESQKAFERDLRAAGGHYYIVRNLNELENCLVEFEASVKMLTGAD